MPLYAITEKRIAKRKREDEDGTTDMKAALGVEDGSEDSDESGDSDEDEDESSEQEDDEDEDEEEDDRDGDDDDSSSEEGDDDDKEEEEDDDGSSNSEASSSGTKSPAPMSIEQVSENPIYKLPHPPYGEHSKGCIICPGKTLKHDRMVEVHLRSGSHGRAVKRWDRKLKQFKKGRVLDTDDPRVLVEEIIQEVERTKANQGIGSLKKWSTKHRLLRAMGKENEPTPAEIRAKKRQARKLEQRPAKIARKIAKQEKKRKIKEDKEKLRLEKGIKKLSTAEKKELRRKKRMENGEEFRDKSRKRTSPRMIRKRERDRKQSLVAAASGDAGANQVIGSGANRQALGGGGKNRQERRQNGKWGSRS